MIRNRFNNDEPTDSPGVGQILTDTTTGEDSSNQGQVWLRAQDNTSPKRFSPWTVGADAVAWLAGAAVFARVVVLVQRAIGLGMVSDVVASLALLTAVAIILYALSRTRKTDRLYHLVLFTIGVLIAIL